MAIKNPDFKCGAYGCRNEAKRQLANLDERVASAQKEALKYKQKEALKYKDEAPSLGQIADRLVRCGVHSKETRYEKWVPLTDAVKAEVVAYRLKRAAELREERAAKAEAERVRQQDTAVVYWRQLAEEPDYVLKYEEDRWGGEVRRKWAIYSAADIAAWEEAGKPEHRLHSVAEAVAKENSEPEAGIIRPAYLETRVSSHLTAKLVPVWAEALTKAAEVVNAMNERLRKQHAEVEEQRQREEG